MGAGRIVIESYGVVALSALTLTAIGAGALHLLGVDLGGSSLPLSSSYLHRLGIPGIFLMAAACSLGGGYFAAFRGKRAPIAAAVALGVFWLCVALSALALQSRRRSNRHTSALDARRDAARRLWYDSRWPTA